MAFPRTLLLSSTIIQTHIFRPKAGTHRHVRISCGPSRFQDFAIYTINDHSTDYYVALSFYVDCKCSSELFETYIGYICDVLKSVFGCCSISSPASSCNTCDLLASSCDFVFAMQRLELPNDIIKIIASYC